MSETTLILGAGVGGLAAANDLSRRLRGRHRIIVVDRESAFRYAPSFPWVMTGARRPEQVARPFIGLERKGIDVVGAVTPSPSRECASAALVAYGT